MCGAYNVINDPFVDSLTERLGVPQVEARGIRVPASSIQVVRETARGRELADAKWWLLLGRDGKPDYRYATFNSRSDKLFSSRLTQGPFRTARCVVPASGVIEGQNKHYHYLTGRERALALGGIYKSYCIDGETVLSASIITCPGNPKLDAIHRKSVPLMLDTGDDALMDMWLDPDFQDSEAFADLLNNRIRQDLRATPIAGARALKPAGATVEIAADE